MTMIIRGTRMKNGLIDRHSLSPVNINGKWHFFFVPSWNNHGRTRPYTSIWNRPGPFIKQKKINKKIVDNNPVQRGDVMVFRYPVDPRQDYIKRVVGLPGDEVSFINQTLSINGQPVPSVAKGEFFEGDTLRYEPKFEEKLGEVSHEILLNPRRQAYYGPDPKAFPMAQNCRYSAEGVVCKVPPGHYFMMGDNRDNSQDSRFWGFVPDENIVGRAFFVWMNFGNLGRIGAFN